MTDRDSTSGGNSSISLSVDGQVVCDKCGQQNAVTVWPILSSVDRPDLVDRLMRGTLGPPCSNCRSLLDVNTPMLVHRPEQGGTTVLAFGGVPDLQTYEESSETANRLATGLFAQLGLGATDVPTYIVMVPRLALPHLLRRDLRADLAVHPDLLDLPAEIAGSYRSVLRKLRERAGLP